MKDEIYPGDRVLVFDSRLFEDDKTTPLSVTMKPATVICRYGYRFTIKPSIDWIYSDMVDVLFDHRPERVSKAHFTDGVTKIREGENDRQV